MEDNFSVDEIFRYRAEGDIPSAAYIGGYRQGLQKSLSIEPHPNPKWDKRQPGANAYFWQGVRDASGDTSYGR